MVRWMRKRFGAMRDQHHVVTNACHPDRSLRFSRSLPTLSPPGTTPIPQSRETTTRETTTTMSTPSLLTVSDYVNLPTVPADVRYRYGTDAEQIADLYLPPNAAHSGGVGYPVVILIHGGCWGRTIWPLVNWGQFSRVIADQGIAVWSLEYRRIGNGGGWPTTFSRYCDRQ